jgi:ABC-type uncharacterized transport system permease subunit
MRKLLKELFNDNNSINEKSVIGFIAFFMMVLTMFIDIIKGWMGKEFVINEFIFDGFLIITLGSFGIGSIDKWINKKNLEKNEPTTEE